MWAVYTGVLKPEARENPDAFYDKPFDVFVSYYDTGIYRLPYEWEKRYGPGKQMDWGSWLYIVDKKSREELLNPECRAVQVLPAEEGVREAPERLPAVKVKDIPDQEWYGVLEVECY